MNLNNLIKNRYIINIKRSKIKKIKFYGKNYNLGY